MGIENPHCFRPADRNLHDTTSAARFCLGTFWPPLADDPLPPRTGSNFFPVPLLAPLADGRSCLAPHRAPANPPAFEPARSPRPTAWFEYAAPLACSLRSDSFLLGLRRALRALAGPFGAPPLGRSPLKARACNLLPMGSAISAGGVVKLGMCRIPALSAVAICAPFPPRFRRFVCAISRT